MTKCLCKKKGIPELRERCGEHCDVHELVRLSSENSDWEALYLNGKLIAEGDGVWLQGMLCELSNIISSTYRLIEISDGKADFSESLEEVLK